MKYVNHVMWLSMSITATTPDMKSPYISVVTLKKVIPTMAIFFLEPVCMTIPSRNSSIQMLQGLNPSAPAIKIVASKSEFCEVSNSPIKGNVITSDSAALTLRGVVASSKKVRIMVRIFFVFILFFVYGSFYLLCNFCIFFAFM